MILAMLHALVPVDRQLIRISYSTYSRTVVQNVYLVLLWILYDRKQTTLLLQCEWRVERHVVESYAALPPDPCENCCRVFCVLCTALPIERPGRWGTSFRR